MLDRNFILSLGLAFLLIFGYNAYYQMRFGPYLDKSAKELALGKGEKKKGEPIPAETGQATPHPADTTATEPVAQPPAQLAAQPEAQANLAKELPPPAASAPNGETKEGWLTVNTGRATIRLSTKGALIKSYKLNDYHDAKGRPVELIMDESGFAAGQRKKLQEAKDGGKEKDFIPVSIYPTTGLKFPKEEFSALINNGIFTHDAASRETLVSGAGAPTPISFTYTDPSGVVVRKKYTFHPDEYMFDLEVEVVSAPQWGQFTYSLVWFGLNDNEDEKTRYLSYHRPVLKIGSLYRMDDPDKKNRSREYKGAIAWAGFAHKYYTVIGMMDPKREAIVRTNFIDEYNTTLEWEGKSGAVSSVRFFLGPKRHDLLGKLGDGQTAVIDYGWFDIAAQPLFWLLNKFHDLLGNWGWAIMMLTLTVKTVLFPLSQKAFRSMKRLQKLQPHMKKIQEVYKHDKEKMNKELMDFYRANKVNPMGGCLPMFLQIPIFFALYKVLYESIELKGVPWILWITDLTQQDPYYVTPLLMGATMFLQQWMTPSAGDPTQRQIMLIMPVVFTFMFLSFPSGLILYWLVNNVLSIIQQWIINRESFEENEPQAKTA